MADAKKAEAASGGEAPVKPKKKLLLFIIIGVVALALAGVGAVLLLKKSHPADEEVAEGEEGHAKSKKAKKKDGKEAPPVFVKLEPFTVKLQSESGENYLQTTPELRVLDAPLGDKIKQYTPEIRHRVLLILTAKKPADVATPQGVQLLSNEIRVAINRIIDGPKESSDKGKKKGATAADEPATFPDEADPEDSVQAVLFTSLIVQ